MLQYAHEISSEAIRIFLDGKNLILFTMGQSRGKITFQKMLHIFQSMVN